MSIIADRADYAALGDRMRYLLGLRIAFAAVTLVWAAAWPQGLMLPAPVLAGSAIGYTLVALVGDWLGRRSTGSAVATMSVLLLLDGAFLALAMYATGGTLSPARFLVYLHLVAVSLLASYRTGLKIALWHTLLLFASLYAQAAQMLPPIDVDPGQAIAIDRLPVLNVTAFWLFALATSLFSAANEHELRQRRADLQAMVDVGARLDAVADPLGQSRVVLEGLVKRFRFARALMLGTSDGRVLVLAEHGAVPSGSEARDPDAVIRRAWDRREPIAVRRLDPARNPVLSAALPGARNLLVAPMFADSEPMGAIVVEHRAGIAGIERRVVSVVAQLASTAALNLRNAVLLRHVRDLAERDALTGAANRRTFQANLEQVLGGDGRDDHASVVLFIDLDDFKVVNDTLGHSAGDALLVAVTQRIIGLVREGDLVARLGGDEFAILTGDRPDLVRTRVMAERLVRELRAPYTVNGHHVSISASIGIASARDALDDPAELVRNADVAMYMAKANGKAGFAVFDPGMHAAIRERHELSLDIQRAVTLDQLRLRYQPIVDLTSGRVVGAEALVRWQHPERGLILPGQFIELAEENGSILPIGRWIMREACRQLAAWTREGIAGPDVFVGVNVSAREIQERGFVDRVRETLADTGVDARAIVLEITETALLRATAPTIETLSALRELGVRIMIDDFGTGYFSLSHLRQFPVDALKIASEFVQEASSSERSSALAGAIVAMAGTLGLETVAEGIETPDQAKWMQSLACTYGQGYLFSRPLAAPEFSRTVALEPADLARAANRAARAPDGRAPYGDGDSALVLGERSTHVRMLQLDGAPG